MEEDFLNLEEVEALAKKRMSKMSYEYYAAGAESEQTLADNRASFAQFRILPRILRDVSSVDTSCEFLGRRIRMPVLVAPMAMHGLADPQDKEVATARAAAALDVPMCVSTMATCSISEVASSGHPFLLFQLYVIRDRGAVEGWVREAEALGYKALVVTVDAPRLGRREADERNGFALPDGLELSNLAALAQRHMKRQQQQQEGQMQQQQEEQQQDKQQQQRGAVGSTGGGGGDSAPSPPQGGAPADGSGLFRLFADEVDDTLTWDAIPWLRSITELPILVKGVLSPDDAVLALQHGAHGVIVSNHGGRQLDSSPSALDMLPHVVRAVRGHPGGGAAAPVLMDGGVRRGTDVIKALCLGADGVLLGRPVLYGLAARGRAGAERVLSILQQELEQAMALCGCARVVELGPRLLLRFGCEGLVPVAGAGAMAHGWGGSESGPA